MRKTTKRVLWQWWRARQNEWAYSGVALWVELYRDWRCAKLRAERRERDRVSAKKYKQQPGSSLSDLMLQADWRMLNSQAAYMAAAQQAQNPYAQLGLQQARNYDPYGNLLGLGRLF